MADEAWYPCIFEISDPENKLKMAGPVLQNVDGTDFQMQFRLPLPSMMGNKSLSIDGVRIGVLEADGANYISQVSVNGMTHKKMKVFFEQKGAINSSQLKKYSFAKHDCGGYESVLVRIWCNVSAGRKLAITSVSLHCSF